MCFFELFIPYFFSFIINMNAANSFKFNVLSLNVRGIGDQIKRRCIYYLLTVSSHWLKREARNRFFVASFVVEAESL